MSRKHARERVWRRLRNAIGYGVGDPYATFSRRRRLKAVRARIRNLSF